MTSCVDLGVAYRSLRKPFTVADARKLPRFRNMLLAAAAEAEGQ